jgi:hypothetical protein
MISAGDAMNAMSDQTIRQGPQDITGTATQSRLIENEAFIFDHRVE